MFCQKLRQARIEAGLTQQKTADTAGIALRTLQAYEQGTRQPNIQTLARLADALNVSTDFLLERTEKH